MALAPQRRWGQRGGRPARSIQAVEPLAIPDERQRIAADAIRGWFDDGERDPRRQRRIHGIATLPEDSQPGLRGQRLACGDHATRREHWLASARKGERIEVERKAY